MSSTIFLRSNYIIKAPSRRVMAGYNERLCVSGGTALAYSYVDFSPDGSLLASMGSAPDYMLTLWDWKHELVVLRCKAFSQEVYRVTFSPENPAHMTTSGSGHIKQVAMIVCAY